jgi:hypothetical protein
MSLNRVLKEILHHLHQHNLRLKAVYLPGRDNSEADKLSRIYDSTDCQLDPAVFQQFCEEFQVQPSLDAFTSSQNRQVERFYSLHYDKEALGSNSLFHSWEGEKCVYAFPPIPLIGKVMRKAQHERVPLVLITPDWEALPSYTTLQKTCRRWIALPSTQQCVKKGKGMIAAGADLAPGSLRVWLL